MTGTCGSVQPPGLSLTLAQGGVRRAVLGEGDHKDSLTVAWVSSNTAKLKSSKPTPGLALRRSFPNSPAQATFLQHLSQGCPPLTDFTLRRRSRTLRQGCLGVAVLGVGGEDHAVCRCIACTLV